MCATLPSLVTAERVFQVVAPYRLAGLGVRKTWFALYSRMCVGSREIVWDFFLKGRAGC